MKSFTILISHASDVIKELDSIERAVKRFNDLFSEFLNTTLKTCIWESGSIPINLYDRPQGGVNEQLVVTSDMCIAIFRTRFGLPRGGKDKDGVEYQSGTEEEIALMTESRKPVFVYFLNESCINLNGLDLEQYKKVKQFKIDYGKKYLYAIYNDNEDTYKTESDLEYQVFNHLCNYFIRDKKFIKTNINDNLYLNLLGGFSKENKKDLEILKYVTQNSDDQIKLMIERLLSDIRKKDKKSVFQVSRNCISVTNRFEFWQQNGYGYGDNSIFEKFRDAAKQVLSNPSNYSESLVNGISETLALIKNRSENLTNLQAFNISYIADDVVHSLFFEYNNKEKCRATLKKFCGLSQRINILSTLAEASPEYFLEAIDLAFKKMIINIILIYCGH